MSQFFSQFMLAFVLIRSMPLMSVSAPSAATEQHTAFTAVSTVLAGKTLMRPGGVAIDPMTGNLFVADTKNHQIKIVTYAGVVTVLAGSGKPGAADGVGASATFHEPAGLAFDTRHRLLYVADRHNHLIRRVSLDGTVTRVAGTGKRGFHDGFALTAELDQPAALAIDDAGAIYVADSANSAIRRIGVDGEVITLAGDGRRGFVDGALNLARFAEPEGIAVAADGTIYVSDTGNHCIRTIHDGSVSTIAGTAAGYADGPSMVARFREPRGIALDGAGELFVADAGNALIRRVVVASGLVSTVAGVWEQRENPPLVDGPLNVATFNDPTSIAFAGALFIADSGHDAIRVIRPTVQLVSLDPRRGPTRGENEIEVNGFGFAPGNAQVELGGIGTTNVLWVRSTQLVVTAPAHGPGVVDASVSTAFGADTLNDAYTYLDPPTLTAIKPQKGRLTGGEIATIRGSAFINGGTDFVIGANPVNDPVVESPETATVTTPPGNAGSAAVVVKTPGGEATLPDGFTYFAPPRIISFTPQSGPAGTVVSIAGENFDSDPAGDDVRFGAATASVLVATPMEITTTVPPGTTTGRIVVTTAGGTAGSASDFVLRSLVSITLDPAAAQLVEGATRQFMATGTYTDGLVVELTSSATWSSEDSAIASVDQAGLVIAGRPGKARIQAAKDGIAGTVQIEVRSAGPVIPPDPATMAPPIDSTIPTTFAGSIAFLYSGENAIQTGVSPGAIESRSAAVIRGRVTTMAGDALPGVRVAVHQDASVGSTSSRADGAFDLVVNGGGSVALSFERAGMVPVHRHVETPWNDFAVIDDVAMMPYDTSATAIDLSALQNMAVARGSEVADEDGVRRSTLLFEPGTTATMRLPDGLTSPLPRLTVRATEVTIGRRGAMPAELPPESGYTYCVELSVDEAVAAGADAVELNKPVNVYTENFLGFSVGSTVPSGYYDRKSAAWVASDNGRVVGIVSIANGVADVDVDGDGLADEAAASSLGITDEERRSLAGLYVAGQTLWRVPVLHFTPYDFNWPYRGPADAEFPDMPRPSPDDPVENQSCQAGSIIECESLTLGESIPISGTPFTLHYRSRSSPGFRAGRELEIPVSKAAVPASLKRIEVDLIVAGQHIHSTLPPLPNQKQTFRWDARDAYGRMLYANRAMTVRIIYRYDAVYVGSGLASRAFAAAGQQFDINPARNEVSYSQEYTVRLRGPRPDQGFGGWSLDALHSYESDNQLLHLGTGSDIKFEARATTPETTVPPFLTAQVVRVGPDGSIYAAASPCGAVIRLFPSGQVQVLGGTGSLPASDGATATSVRLCVRKDMGIASNGDVMFIDASENGTQTIFRLRDGVLRLLAKVPSNFALFSLAVAPSGVVYFTHENDLERVDAGGNVSVVAAADASRRFRSVRVGQDGNLYVWVDEGVPFGNDDRIYRWPLPGDPKAVFNIGNETVLDYTADRDGRLYFLRGLDSPCNGCTQVRIVDTDGTIRNYFNALSFLAPGSIALNPKGEIVYTDTCRSGPVGRCIFIGDTTAALTDSTGWIAAIAPRQEAFRFTNVGQHVETRDSVTNALIHRFSYDQRGFPVTTVNADGLLTRIERAATGEATAIIAPNGDRTELVYGADGRLAGADGPGGQHHEFTYTPDGLLQSYANPRGSTSTYEYDSLGRLKRASNATGGVKQLTFSSPVAGSETVQLSTGQGRLWRYTVTKKAEGFLDRTITIPSGLVTSASVAPLLTTAVLPDGTTTRLERKSDAQWGAMAPLTSAIFVTLPSGLRMITRLTSSIVLSDPTDPLSVTATTDVINVNGANSTITFTAGDRKVHAVSPLGRVIESFLDINGRVREVRLPGIASTVLTRDARGRLESITQGARQARIEWDAGDQVEALTDPTGRATHFTRDAAGRVTTVLLPDSRMIEYSYDENGNVLSIKPPGRPIHEFTYDAADRPLTYTAPGGDPPARYSYSPDGDLQRIVLPGEEEVTLGYDSGGRLSSIVMPAGSYSYSYLGGGQVGSISDPGGGRVALAWNGSLPTGTTWTGAVAGSVSFDWDSSFRLTSETTAGANVAFAYDADGLLTKAGALTMTRDSQTGLLTGTSIGNVSESFGYNEFGELVSLTASRNGGAVLSLSYERDTAGRITSITEGGGTRHFDYDPAGRLMRVTIDGTAMAEYDYDANGNRTAHRYVGGTSLGTYDDRDRLLTYEGTTYTYSRSGDLYSKTEAGVTTTYAYDAVGNLRKVILPTGSTIEYVIDGQNRRIGKKVDGTLVRGWLYSGQLQIVAELGAGSSVISRFVYGSRTNVPDYMIRSGVTYRILGDHLGSPRLVVNVTDGTVMEALTYDEFGNVLSDTNPGFQPFGFAGGLYDRDTGLVRFGARDYDPHTGRWTAKDPLLFGGGDTNLYAYALQDPVNFIDPSGELFRGVIPAGEGLGQAALNSYADTLTDPRASAAAKVASAIGGTFAALWTPCTSDRTFGTLLAAYGASGVLGSTANFGTWMENPVLYEFGQKTLRDAAFGELGTLSVIERGSAILKGGILNAVFNLGGNWLKTLGTGPTPGAALGLLGGGIVEGVMGRPSNCGCQ